MIASNYAQHYPTPGGLAAGAPGFAQRREGFNKIKRSIGCKAAGLPWVKLEKQYDFKEEGCPGYTLFADNFNGIIEYLNQHDASMVVVSRASPDKMLNFHEEDDVECEENYGTSVFYKEADGGIFHTYSCYARSVDTLSTNYQLLDLLPKGRSEQDHSFRRA